MNPQNKIRLSNDYLETIRFLAKDIFKSTDVWVFGSRVDLEKKGGDIDIFVQTEQTKDILSLKLSFLREFMKRCGEQKVDLVVQSGSGRKKLIFEIAKREGVKI